ncbi:glycoside hydrolase family 3 C-terminal domain-containing protein [Paenibacillus phocaensis]|uniref:glycoside hydrolase family 3 C-terminal domain-containing protein n=1 Tax=Paenibacillus phocaensis TaxID=1776378 RepID=UPI000839B2BE|nr:glycoside hydrolase family 3 C-terminal domain-containing protein [Paenibacillus phocaensis]
MQSLDPLIQAMTIEEKAALVAGTEFWKTNPIPRLSIPSIYMTDGPCGLRKQGEQTDHLGLNQSEPTTSFPTGATLAASWNPDNVRAMGKAIAQECHHFGVNILLGPAVNIKRNPRCGRNFEYFSEDPTLSGVLGSAFVEGVQNEGIGVSLKHFAVNNNENFRFMGDSVVDERALREIYLKAFEMIVKNTRPVTVMCAYNKVNGVYCAENYDLLTGILRNEWGFDGAVISDWGAVSDRVEGIKAGMDLEMPGDCDYFRKSVIDAANSGSLSMTALDQAVKNILTLIERTSDIKYGMEFDKDEHHKISCEIAADSAVLLKNDGSLPLSKEQQFLVIGDLFDKMRFQGAGSSLINPTRKTTPQMAFDERRITYQFVRGYRESEVLPEREMEHEALKLAEKAEVILFFGGQTDYTESEGYDRENMRLPENQLSLINQLTKLNKKIIFVLFGGSPVELPFESAVSAILNMYLPGQAGGEAAAQLLFGEKNPTGKLAETWMEKYSEVPFGETFVQGKSELYQESVYVGYRYYDHINGKGVKYPFGYGLSYTQFEYSSPELEGAGEQIIVRCQVTNSGGLGGAEVIQLYVANPHTDVFKPVKELRAFSKVYLKPGETRWVEMRFSKKDLAYYHVGNKEWVIENGEYQVMLAASSVDVRLSLNFTINDQPVIPSPYDRSKLPHYYSPGELKKVSVQEFETLLGRKVEGASSGEPRFTLDSRLDELQSSFIGRIFYNSVVGIGEKQFNKAQKLPESPERDMERKNGMFLMKMLPNNSIRSMSVSSSGRFSYNIARGLIELLNGRPLKGIKFMMTKDRLQPLPKNQKKRIPL